MAKTNIIENLFSYLAVYSAFLPILLFALNWKKCKDSRALWIVILYAFFVDFLIGFSVEFFSHKPLKITLYASYTFFEYIAFCYFIFLQIRNKRLKKIMLFVSVAFFTFIVIYHMNVKFRLIDSVPIGIETILVLIFSFYYLYEELNFSSTLFIYYNPIFWIVFGIVIYLAGSFFIYIYAGSLSKTEGRQIWYITNIFSILKNLFFCIGLLLHTKPPKENNRYELDFSSLN